MFETVFRHNISNMLNSLHMDVFWMLFHLICVIIFQREFAPQMGLTHVLIIVQQLLLNFEVGYYHCQPIHKDISVLHIIQHYLIQLWIKIYSFVSLALTMIVSGYAMYQSQLLRQVTGILDICILSMILIIQLKQAFDCSLMQHLLCTAFPVFVIQSCLIFAIIIVLTAELWCNIIMVLQILYFMIQL